MMVVPCRSSALSLLSGLLILQSGRWNALAFHVTVGFFGVEFFDALGQVFHAGRPNDPLPQLRILEVGSQDVNGGLRTYAPRHWEYVGVDLDHGPGVDHVLADPYHYPYEAGTFNAVVSTSAFEHINFFWVTFLEMLRVTRSDGYLFITAPSNVRYHGDMVPPDSWRFFGDAASSLEAWGHLNGYPGVRRLQGFVHPSVPYQLHADNVMLFAREGGKNLQLATEAPASLEVALDHLASHHQCWQAEKQRYELHNLLGIAVGMGTACCTLTEVAAEMASQQARSQMISLGCWDADGNRTYKRCCPFVMTD